MPDKTHNAKDILVEALDTIKATFWIQGQEAMFVSGAWSIDDGDYDWTDWDNQEKAILAKVDAYSWNTGAIVHPGDEKAKVVGVCSIGALALANVTLYDEPLSNWTRTVERDFETWKAGQALAQAIVTAWPYYLANRSAGDIIANWNDGDDRTREEVIEMFEKAMGSPLLAAEKVYEVVAPHRYGTEYTNLYFASEADAQAFIDTDSKLRSWVIQDLGMSEFEVKEFVHDSLVAS